MTTTDSDQHAKLLRMQDNLAKVEALSARLVQALAHRKTYDTALDGPSQDIYMKAAAAYVAGMIKNPAKLMEQQASYWAKTMQHFVAAQQSLVTGAIPAVDTTKDKRFQNPLWDTNPAFSYLKHQYLLNAEAVQTAVDDMETLEAGEKKRIEYFTKQIVDLFEIGRAHV